MNRLYIAFFESHFFYCTFGFLFRSLLDFTLRALAKLPNLDRYITFCTFRGIFFNNERLMDGAKELLKGLKKEDYRELYMSTLLLRIKEHWVNRFKKKYRFVILYLFIIWPISIFDQSTVILQYLLAIIARIINVWLVDHYLFYYYFSLRYTLFLILEGSIFLLNLFIRPAAFCFLVLREFLLTLQSEYHFYVRDPILKKTLMIRTHWIRRNLIRLYIFPGLILLHFQCWFWTAVVAVTNFYNWAVLYFWFEEESEWSENSRHFDDQGEEIFPYYTSSEGDYVGPDMVLNQNFDHVDDSNAHFPKVGLEDHPMAEFEELTGKEFYPRDGFAPHLDRDEFREDTEMYSDFLFIEEDSGVDDTGEDIEILIESEDLDEDYWIFDEEYDSFAEWFGRLLFYSRFPILFFSFIAFIYEYYYISCYIEIFFLRFWTVYYNFVAEQNEKILAMKTKNERLFKVILIFYYGIQSTKYLSLFGLFLFAVYMWLDYFFTGKVFDYDFGWSSFWSFFSLTSFAYLILHIIFYKGPPLERSSSLVDVEFSSTPSAWWDFWAFLVSIPLCIFLHVDSKVSSLTSVIGVPIGSYFRYQNYALYNYPHELFYVKPLEKIYHTCSSLWEYFAHPISTYVVKPLESGLRSLFEVVYHFFSPYMNDLFYSIFQWNVLHYIEGFIHFITKIIFG